jgi:hypothetical protein
MMMLMLTIAHVVVAIATMTKAVTRPMLMGAT